MTAKEMLATDHQPQHGELIRVVAALEDRVDELAKDIVEKTHGGSYADELRKLRRDLDEVCKLLLVNTEQGDKTVFDLRALRIEIFGDVEAKAAWEKQQATGTYPNHLGPKITEPPPGALERLANEVGRLMAEALSEKDTGPMAAAIDGIQASLAFVRRLEAFFGPLIANKNPPLDGAEIASKEYVDEAVRRIAGAIRSETSDAVGFLGLASRMTIGAPDQQMDDRTKLPPPASTGTRLVHRLSLLWNREREAIYDAFAPENFRARTSRVESLIHALTGRRGGS